MWQDAHTEEALRSGARVTLAMGDSAEHTTIAKGPLTGRVVIKGRLAHPLDPKRLHGMYWGYQTRLASNLQAALDDCPFQVCSTYQQWHHHLDFLLLPFFSGRF